MNYMKKLDWKDLLCWGLFLGALVLEILSWTLGPQTDAKGQPGGVDASPKKLIERERLHNMAMVFALLAIACSVCKLAKKGGSPARPVYGL